MNTDKSYRIIWELDVDAPDPTTAVELARKSLADGCAPVFEVHEWTEPDYQDLEPVAMIDTKAPATVLPVPDKREPNGIYMGPTII